MYDKIRSVIKNANNSLQKRRKELMFESTKMRLMCGITAVSIALGSFAMPVNVWADDDDDDDFLLDLIDLDDDESDALKHLHDYDDDDDVDEDDIETVVTLMTMAALADAEQQRQAELAEQQRKLNEALKRASDAERKAAEAKVNGIWVSTTDVQLSVGQTYQIIAGVKPDTASNKGVSFSTSNAGVATIDGSGIIRAINVGSCVITARSNEGGYQAYASVRVSPAPAVAAQTIAQDANWTAIAANMIMTAVPGSVVNLVAPKALSFDAGMINALAARPDVGVLIAYPYNGHTYLLAVPAGYNLAAKKDKTGKVSFLSLAAVKDGKVVTSMVQ